MGVIRFFCEWKLKMTLRGECCGLGRFILVRNRSAVRKSLLLAGGDFLVCIVVACYGIRNQRATLRDMEEKLNCQREKS